MAKKFSELRARMRPEAQLQAEARTESMQTSIKLQALRKRLQVTQASLAERLQVQQAAISKMESRDDLLVSSVMDFVRGLGGRLVLTATFPDKTSFDLTPEPVKIGRPNMAVSEKPRARIRRPRKTP
ncbi:XRE family transcriptional regulator [Herbaspirillum sp. C7C8]|jgi:transcriptional regulator with XRE-family HTH domain|uniref:XRE family transcriptional regulator n=1 Tax=Herbaspirillum sp. C7C8 TaxID=2736665 RepID=UPI001F519303|nr:XRE family transcriptional regulator [Herbaspirillum sp. C7C8]MCI1007032.1 helix-turn-helix transcriptional regulator [Herbaspirillum sp. C7C8]